MKSAAKIGIIGFLVIVALIIVVHEEATETENTGVTARETVSTSSTGTATELSSWLTSYGETSTGTASENENSGEVIPPLPPVDNSSGTVTDNSTPENSTEIVTPPDENKSEIETPRIRTYITKRNDTLSDIAKKFYGSSAKYMKIYEANRDKLSNPARVPIGVELVIPPLDGSDETETTRQPEELERPSSQYRIYVVQEKDTLSSIALKFLGKKTLWKKIYALNRDVIDDPNRLKPGMKIKIPEN